MPNDNTVQSSNYTLLKLIRTGISSLSAMIGTSVYYCQLIGNPILGSINALLFSKKLWIDIWNLNQMPSLKSKLLNSSKKILLGLGTIGLVNYSKFINASINRITPTSDPWPTDLSITTLLSSSSTNLTTKLPWSTHSISTASTTNVDPWPSMLSAINNDDNSLQMDWDTYISLNAYGIANLIAGLAELIPSKFETIRKITNMATGGALISSGVAMGINNDFVNAYAIPTITAGACEIINNLLPMETNRDNTELQETSFTNDTARLINVSVNNYGSNDSIDSLTSDVIYERPVYCSTVQHL